MGEIRYIISEASKKIDVEQHTLRYWEDEIGLAIPRNEMGHRYYREEDVEIIKAIKILKEKGYQLRAIKMLLPEIQKLKHLDREEVEKRKQEWDKEYMDVIVKEEEKQPFHLSEVDKQEEEKDTLVEKSVGKMEQFKSIMNQLIVEALQDNNEILSETVSESVTDRVIKEMDYLLRIKEEREEERYKRFDRTLREIQNSRSEYAATKMKGYGKKKGLFRKK